MDLVTGCSGFIGQHLCRYLLDKGHEIIGVDIVSPPKDLGISFKRMDISNIWKCTLKIDTVYHLAALVPMLKKSYYSYAKVNFGGTITTLTGTLRDKFVFVSSSAVYGIPKQCPITHTTEFNPMGYYGYTKRIAEEALVRMRDEIEQLDISIVRPRTVIGNERLGILSIMFEWISQGKDFPMLGDGTNRYQFIDVRDIVEALYLIGTKDTKNIDFNLGTDKFTTLGEELESVCEHANTGSKIKYVSSKYEYVLNILDKLHLSPFVDWHYKTIAHDFYFDVSKEKEVLKWIPKYSNKDMLINAYEWYVNEYKEGNTPHRKSSKQKLINLIKYVM